MLEFFWEMKFPTSSSPNPDISSWNLVGWKHKLHRINCSSFYLICSTLCRLRPAALCKEGGSHSSFWELTGGCGAAGLCPGFLHAICPWQVGPEEQIQMQRVGLFFAMGQILLTCSSGEFFCLRWDLSSGKSTRESSTGPRANRCPSLLATKRWDFESNQGRFQWHLTLRLCMVKQTYKTPLAPASPFLIYKGGNFQDVLTVDNKAFFKNTLRVSKTTFEMSNIF